MAEYSAVPKVSVVLPVHNKTESLPAAVASVLGQTFGDFELLIVDDGSSDDLAPILALPSRDARIQVIRHGHNRGPAAARNTGIKHAKGDYIAFLDSDDVWNRDK